MGKVVPLRQTLPSGPTTIPDKFAPEDKRRLLSWAAREGFTLEQVYFAVRRIRDWTERKHPEPKMRDWVKAVQGYMRDGWPLRGFYQHQKRRGPSHRNPRNGEPVYPATKITDELIERVCKG